MLRKLFGRAFRWGRRQVRGLQDEKGLTMIEYGVMAAFVVVILAAVAFTAGPKLKIMMTCAMDGITSGTQDTACKGTDGGNGDNG